MTLRAKFEEIVAREKSAKAEPMPHRHSRRYKMIVDHVDSLEQRIEELEKGFNSKPQQENKPKKRED